jgi:hypothetical protein
MAPEFGLVLGGVLAALVLYALYQLVTKGIDGWSFGAHILGSSEKIGQKSFFFGDGHIRVHRLKAGGRKWVGIKAAGGGFIGQEYAYIKLTGNDARRLVEALEQALDET